MRTYFPRIAHRLCSLVVVLLLAACGGGGDVTFNVPPTLPGPYQLTFSLDETFQDLHGNQPIRIAVVRSFDNVVVAEGSGTVSDNQNPSFSFAAGAVMERFITYEVHYWIDSNINGSCDPKAIDPQWSVEFFSVTSDKDITTSYQPLLTEDVCGTFS